MEDSQVVEEGILVKFQFHQEEVKHPHYRDKQRPNIMNDLGPPEAPGHLPLANPPCLPEQYNHCGKNFYKKNSLCKHMFVVHGGSRLKKNTARQISG